MTIMCLKANQLAFRCYLSEIDYLFSTQKLIKILARIKAEAHRANNQTHCLTLGTDGLNVLKGT